MRCLLTLTVLLNITMPMKAADAAWQIVPAPRTVESTGGKPFLLQEGCSLSFPEGDLAMERNARFLHEYIQKATGISLKLASDGDIRLELRRLSEEDEHYQICVDDKGIVLRAGTAEGLFRAIQTFRKALPHKPGSVVIPSVMIDDAPAFRYRGMMLDCARHFFSIDFIKKYIDILALHQVNTFHWHLTDDQGWRIEIMRYPRLTEVGAWRSGTVIGNNSDVDDETPYGGYYTQDQIREIVAYAAERFITVVPEIDMPGHMMAAMAAYPDLGCTGGPYQVGHRWGVYSDVLCIGKESSYDFVRNVLDEVLDLFPSKRIHIGGDETPAVRWESCPHCKGLTQADFSRRMVSYLLEKGRIPVGWEEMMVDDIPAEAEMMAWKGMQAGFSAAHAGRDVIWTPLTHCYFDYYQSTPNLYEPSITGMWPIDVEKVWSLNPLPDNLSQEDRKHIIGVQANLWTEYINAGDVVEYMTLPRLAALSEVQWGKGPTFEDFKSRLENLLPLYEQQDWVYAKHLWSERMNTDRWHIE